MRRSTCRWQQDEESTVRKTWVHICWEDSFWVRMLVSFAIIFVNYKHEGELGSNSRHGGHYIK